MRSIWHLLFLFALRTGRFRCLVTEAATVVQALGEALGKALGGAVERVAVDVAHWLPNMPRGHEST